MWKSEMEDVKSFELGLVKAANVDRVVDEPAKVYKEKGMHDYSSARNEDRPPISATQQSQIASCRLGNAYHLVEMDQLQVGGELSTLVVELGVDT